MTREQLRAAVQAERDRAHAAVERAYWIFTRCKRGSPVPMLPHLKRRAELDRKLRQLDA